MLCLAFDARRTTVDLDGFFRPSRGVRAAARREAALEIVGRYYPLEKIPRKTFDALAEMIEDLAAAQGFEPLSSGSPAPLQKPRERPR